MDHDECARLQQFAQYCSIRLTDSLTSYLKQGALIDETVVRWRISTIQYDMVLVRLAAVLRLPDVVWTVPLTFTWDVYVCPTRVDVWLCDKALTNNVRIAHKAAVKSDC